MERDFALKMVTDLESVLIAIVRIARYSGFILAVLIEDRDVAFFKHGETEVGREGQDVVGSVRFKLSRSGWGGEALIFLLGKAAEQPELKDANQTLAKAGRNAGGFSALRLQDRGTHAAVRRERKGSRLPGCIGNRSAKERVDLIVEGRVNELAEFKSAIHVHVQLCARSPAYTCLELFVCHVGTEILFGVSASGSEADEGLIGPMIICPIHRGPALRAIECLGFLDALGETKIERCFLGVLIVRG